MRFINIHRAKKLSPSVKSALAESEANPPKNTVGILFGYADDLIGLATREISTPLNLQYDTVHNLTKALTFYGEVQLHKEGKTTSEARVSIAKALSSTCTC